MIRNCETCGKEIMIAEASFEPRPPFYCTEHFEEEKQRRGSHHYASLLDCGHYRETKASWNGPIETGKPSTPIEAFCQTCLKFSHIVKFARVEDDEAA